MENNKFIRTKTNKKPLNEAFLSFDEVDLGYSKDQVILEASRCLQCKNPKCVLGCPLGNNIPLMNALVKEGKFEEAYQIISKTNSLPSICGRICQQELQCEENCIRNNSRINSEGIAIGSIERFVADFHNKHCAQKTKNKKNGIEVGVIGSGPAGLSCAKTLCELGYKVTVFEKSKEYGGILRYGIPNFCLPRDVLKIEINKLINLGITFKNNYEVNNINDLLANNKFKALFFGVGLSDSRKMGIKGEDLVGVMNSTDYLMVANDLDSLGDEYKNLVTKSKNVVVVGGGNVAIDVDRCAIRFGASSVNNVYRRSEKEMPARKEEFSNAKKECVEFNFLTNPVEIIGINRVNAIKCEKMRLGEPDSSGRCRPIPILGSEFVIPCDLVVMAIGNIADKELSKNLNDLVVDKNGLFVVDQNTMRTSLGSVYAGGDIVTGPTSVVLAIKTGKLAAKSIDESIKKSSI